MTSPDREPLVLLHGFTDTPRTWDLVLPSLARRFDVLVPTLAGHAGGPPISGPITHATLPDAVGHAMDAAGFATAHLVGNSLGGYVALQLATRGRAKSVTALAPAGGWAPGDDSYKATLQHFTTMRDGLRPLAATADTLMETDRGRRNVTTYTTINYQHIPPDLLAAQLRAVVGCTSLDTLVAFALHEGYHLDAASITCPTRIIWGTSDRLLPYPSAATRYQHDWLPHADWLLLDSIGHCPQLDDPTTTSALVTDFIISGAS